MSALETYFRDQFLRAVENSVPHTPELEEKVFEFAQLQAEFFLPSEVPRAPLRTYVNALLILHPVDFGASGPEQNEVFSLTFVREDACLRPLLVATVTLRLIHNEERNTLLPTLTDARPYIFPANFR